MCLGSEIQDPSVPDPNPDPPDPRVFGLLDPENCRIRKKPTPVPVSRGQKGTGSQTRIRNSAILIKDRLLMIPRLKIKVLFPGLIVGTGIKSILEHEEIFI